jgi:hypothetical protein
MNPDETQPKPLPATPNRPWRWQDWVKQSALNIFVFLAFLGLVGAFGLNWASSEAWQRYIADSKAKGEWFEPADFIPPPVPDEKNFLAIPLLKPLIDYTQKPVSPLVNATVWNDPEGLDRLLQLKITASNGLRNSSWREGKFCDLAQWQQSFRQEKSYGLGGEMGKPEEEVLRALAKFAPEIEALRLAAPRPFSRFPMHYEKAFPEPTCYWRFLSNFCRILQLHGAAELASGNTREASEDALLQMRLCQAAESEPLLVPFQTRVFCLENYILPAIWEGMEQHRWSDPQLASFESALARIDLLSDFQRAMRAERTFFISLILEPVQTGTSNELPGELFRWDQGTPGVDMRGLPLRSGPERKGWFERNKVAYCQTSDSWVRVVDPKRRQAFPEIAAKNEADREAEFQKGGGHLDNIIALLSIPPVYETIPRLVAVQSTIDQARIAIALERHRLAHGTYPETLDALAPALLPQIPRDLITCEPLHYRKVTFAGFVLNSVGWNGKDDGGNAAGAERTPPDWTQGDWVWPRVAAKP